MRTAWLSAAALGLACAERRPAPAAATDSVRLAPRDSLVATTASGTEVWFVLARHDTGDSRACTARTLEIRRGQTRIPVPLLYTVTVPEILNDTTLRARLANRCAPGDAYLVDLRTGRPTRDASR